MTKGADGSVVNNVVEPWLQEDSHVGRSPGPADRTGNGPEDHWYEDRKLQPLKLQGALVGTRLAHGFLDEQRGLTSNDPRTMARADGASGPVRHRAPARGSRGARPGAAERQLLDRPGVARPIRARARARRALPALAAALARRPRISCFLLLSAAGLRSEEH